MTSTYFGAATFEWQHDAVATKSRYARDNKKKKVEFYLLVWAGTWQSHKLWSEIMARNS
ncbi:hypothetical protein P692DRAFT_20830704 [Suillus brevipes Sb2]|nr:hypothetical protein P692DRAFT_20830704 [Suillus brevipes Sb2]